MQKLRDELPELKRPKNLIDLKKLRKEIETYVKKNNRYQRKISTLQHQHNEYGPNHGRLGDAIVREALQAKMFTEKPPWPFNQQLREYIKIFYHCYSPLLSKLKEELAPVAREIEHGLVSLPSNNKMIAIRKDMSRITATFQWMLEHERICFMEQIDSSGKEATSEMIPPPGVPHQMTEFKKELISASDRQNKLDDKLRGSDANRTAKTALMISFVSLVVATLSFFVSKGLL